MYKRLSLLTLLFIATKVLGMESENPSIFLVPEVKHDVSMPLSKMRPILSKTNQYVIVPIHHLPSGKKEFVSQQDVVAQLFQGASLNVSAVLNFLGIGVGLGAYSPSVTPPDTTGAPGLTQYVQIVNSSLAIFNKFNGNLEFGPVDTNTLWQGFGTVCESTNSGDALVKYDQLSNRWVISQFAHNTVSGNVAPPFLQCVAVSTTSDARSPYYRYAFEFSNFNDYGKLGLSPDGYFMSFFMFNQGAYVGPLACALPRYNMIAGAAATMQCLNPSPQSNVIDLIPADLDGTTLPPPKSPEFFLSLNKQTHTLNLWKFAVNWNNPSATTFKGPIRIADISPFSLPCSDQGPRGDDDDDLHSQTQGCVPQPNTGLLLDILDDRLMYRLSYRQFTNYGALVINHSVGGVNAVAGVRWYEIHIINNGLYVPSLIQQGTFSPDSNSRWMGSIAMDKNKNIALGYSVSSSTLFPSISITGRTPHDPYGTMRNEILVVAGGGSQTGTYRWGDYSTMSVDPTDDCTFWFTTEYLQTTQPSASWSTYVTAFRFPNCA
jgi:hypothetical protein